MTKFLKNKRYIYDPLYGIIYLPDSVWDIIPSPELQRLREVRLCNINSFCVIGGANINRYEHAIGTCYLAYECLNSWPLLNPITEKEHKLFLIAALLHDMLSGAFGHSIEYVESLSGFEHERPIKYMSEGKDATYKYELATLEPIFFGMTGDLLSKITEEDLKEIDKFVSGKGRFGFLINSTMDLDNIDNVFRFAYHIGIVKSGNAPLKLAKSLYIENGILIVRNEALSLIEEWHNVRKRLYSLLLLNPEEFSAKCMLTEATEIAKSKDERAFNWYDVDFEILEKLSKISAETAEIISRLMKGDLYGCIAIFSTIKTDKYEIFANLNRRIELENTLTKLIRSSFAPRYKSAMIALHSIIDINKTERQVCIQTDDDKVVQIGKSSKQLLIGVFFKNRDLSMYKIPNDNAMHKIRQKIYTSLSNILEDSNLKEIELYAEIRDLK